MMTILAHVRRNLALVVALVALFGTLVNGVVSVRILQEKVQENAIQVQKLTIIVDDHVKTTTALSTTLATHLQVSEQMDSITEMRFKRIEEQLGRIETKIDELKGWRVIKP